MPTLLLPGGIVIAIAIDSVKLFYIVDLLITLSVSEFNEITLIGPSYKSLPAYS
jgi:hypothetical protein